MPYNCRFSSPYVQQISFQSCVWMEILSHAKVGKKGGFQISNGYWLFAGKIMAENWFILTKPNLKYEYWHSISLCTHNQQQKNKQTHIHPTPQPKPFTLCHSTSANVSTVHGSIENVMKLANMIQQLLPSMALYKSSRL